MARTDDLNRLKKLVPGAGTPGAESQADGQQAQLRQQRMGQYLPPGASFDQPLGPQAAAPQGAPMQAAPAPPDQMAMQQMAMQEAAQQAMAAQRSAALQPVQQQLAVPGAMPDVNAMAGQQALEQALQQLRMQMMQGQGVPSLSALGGLGA